MIELKTGQIWSCVDEMSGDTEVERVQIGHIDRDAGRVELHDPLSGEHKIGYSIYVIEQNADRRYRWKLITVGDCGGRGNPRLDESDYLCRTCREALSDA